MRSWTRVALLATAMPAVSWGQDLPSDIPRVEHKPYTVGGYFELRPTRLWLDTGAALYRVRWYDERKTATDDLRQQLLLDAAWRGGSWSMTTRGVVDVNHVDEWSSRGTVYEAYAAFKPRPSLGVAVGKKRQNWGKGYVWNPVAFVDRPKNPEDPTLAQEGYLVVDADWIRSFEGALQTLSFTPVLIPVYRDVNASYGRVGHVNAAGRLYVLLLDTDIDFLFLVGGSRPERFGADVARNIVPNVEVHGELAFVRDHSRPIVEATGAMRTSTGAAVSTVLGVRYLTRSDITIIADYHHAGTGFTQAELRDFHAFVGTAWDAYGTTGDATQLKIAGKAAAAGYGGANPMRDYLYVRASKPDAFGWLYFTPAMYGILNMSDRSFSVTQEFQYRAFTNLELRSQLNVISGPSGTEFGEKPANLRLEVRGRYYF